MSGFGPIMAGEDENQSIKFAPGGVPVRLIPGKRTEADVRVNGEILQLLPPIRYKDLGTKIEGTQGDDTGTTKPDGSRVRVHAVLCDGKGSEISPPAGSNLAVYLVPTEKFDLMFEQPHSEPDFPLHELEPLEPRSADITSVDVPPGEYSVFLAPSLAAAEAVSKRRKLIVQGLVLRVIAPNYKFHLLNREVYVPYVNKKNTWKRAWNHWLRPQKDSAKSFDVSDEPDMQDEKGRYLLPDYNLTTHLIVPKNARASNLNKERGDYLRVHGHLMHAKDTNKGAGSKHQCLYVERNRDGKIGFAWSVYESTYSVEIPHAKVKITKDGRLCVVPQEVPFKSGENTINYRICRSVELKEVALPASEIESLEWRIPAAGSGAREVFPDIKKTEIEKYLEIGSLNGETDEWEYEWDDEEVEKNEYLNLVNLLGADFAKKTNACLGVPLREDGKLELHVKLKKPPAAGQNVRVFLYNALVGKKSGGYPISIPSGGESEFHKTVDENELRRVLSGIIEEFDDDGSAVQELRKGNLDATLRAKLKNHGIDEEEFKAESGYNITWVRLSPKEESPAWLLISNKEDHPRYMFSRAGSKLRLSVPGDVRLGDLNLHVSAMKPADTTPEAMKVRGKEIATALISKLQSTGSFLPKGKADAEYEGGFTWRIKIGSLEMFTVREKQYERPTKKPTDPRFQIHLRGFWDNRSNQVMLLPTAERNFDPKKHTYGNLAYPLSQKLIYFLPGFMGTSLHIKDADGKAERAFPEPEVVGDPKDLLVHLACIPGTGIPYQHPLGSSARRESNLKDETNEIRESDFNNAHKSFIVLPTVTATGYNRNSPRPWPRWRAGNIYQVGDRFKEVNAIKYPRVNLTRGKSATRIEHMVYVPLPFDWRLPLGEQSLKASTTSPAKLYPFLADIARDIMEQWRMHHGIRETRDREKNADGTEIDATRYPFLSDKITVTGHSTGGVAARALLAFEKELFMDAYKTKVTRGGNAVELSKSNEPLIERTCFINVPLWGTPKGEHAAMTGQVGLNGGMASLIDNRIFRYMGPDTFVLYILCPSNRYGEYTTTKNTDTFPNHFGDHNEQGDYWNTASRLKRHERAVRHTAYVEQKPRKKIPGPAYETAPPGKSWLDLPARFSPELAALAERFHREVAERTGNIKSDVMIFNHFGHHTPVGTRLIPNEEHLRRLEPRDGSGNTRVLNPNDMKRIAARLRTIFDKEGETAKADMDYVQGITGIIDPDEDRVSKLDDDDTLVIMARQDTAHGKADDFALRLIDIDYEATFNPQSGVGRRELRTHYVFRRRPDVNPAVYDILKMDGGQAPEKGPRVHLVQDLTGDETVPWLSQITVNDLQDKSTTRGNVRLMIPNQIVQAKEVPRMTSVTHMKIANQFWVWEQVARAGSGEAMDDVVMSWWPNSQAAVLEFMQVHMPSGRSTPATLGFPNKEDGHIIPNGTASLIVEPDKDPIFIPALVKSRRIAVRIFTGAVTSTRTGGEPEYLQAGEIHEFAAAEATKADDEWGLLIKAEGDEPAILELRFA